MENNSRDERRGDYRNIEKGGVEKKEDTGQAKRGVLENEGKGSVNERCRRDTRGSYEGIQKTVNL